MIDNILIIEGDSPLRRKLTSVLTKADFGVASAPGYFEALMKLDEFKPDMIILDEVLPHRDGREACCQLHRNLGIPIILLGRNSSSYARGKRCLLYCILLNRPVRLYSAISLDTCDLEYPVTRSIYRRITPFSLLLRR